MKKNHTISENGNFSTIQIYFAKSVLFAFIICICISLLGTTLQAQSTGSFKYHYGSSPSLSRNVMYADKMVLGLDTLPNTVSQINGVPGITLTIAGPTVITNTQIKSQLLTTNPKTWSSAPTSGWKIAENDKANFNLWVEDGIMSEGFYVTHPCIWDGDNSDCPNNWGDFVFEENYKLKPLEEVKKFITKNKHLPGIPSATEIMKGYELHNMNKMMVVKIEELTLYTIDQNEAIKTLKLEKQKVEEKLEVLSQQVDALKKMIETKK